MALSFAGTGTAAATQTATTTICKKSSSSSSQTMAMAMTITRTHMHPLKRHLATKSKAKAKSNTKTTKSQATTATAKATIARPKQAISSQERTALRKARKERAITAQSSSQSSTKGSGPSDARVIFGLGLGVPTLIVAWGVIDPNSPPAKLASLLGFDELVDSFAKPNDDKLLPSFDEMPNMPKDFQPMTLVIDLENTLVNSTWDRKHGWRTAKRPGVIKFLQELAQYYEIVIITPSPTGAAEPVLHALANESRGSLSHILFREACYYKDGTYMKDISRLNRNPSRVILIDDDEHAAALNPDNLIRVKPYTDPKDRKDNTLERLIPFLIEIATENYDDTRLVLSQFKGMDADAIADDLEARVSRVQSIRSSRGGLSSWANTEKMKPEMAPVDRSRRAPGGGISSMDLIGGAPSSSLSGSSAKGKGLGGWLQNRQEQQAKEKMEKMEHWNKIMMERQEGSQQN